MVRKRKTDVPESEVKLAIPDFRVRNVEDELLKHAQSYAEWAQELVRLENLAARQEEQIENYTAPLRDDIRDDLRMTRGKSGVTEKMVEDRVTLNREVRERRSRLRKTNNKLRLAKAILKSLEAKLSAMQSYARLRRGEFDNS